MKTANAVKPIVRIFSATKAEDRARLGDAVTRFLREADLQSYEIETLQSSDNSFHCVTVVIHGMEYVP